MTNQLPNHHPRLIQNRELNKVRFDDTFWQEDELFVEYFAADVVAEPVLVVEAKGGFVDGFDQGKGFVFHQRKHVAQGRGFDGFAILFAITF